jgi:hypothetical protein
MREDLNNIVDELDDLISTAWGEIYAALDACGSPTPARMPRELANLLHQFDVLAFKLHQVAEQAAPRTESSHSPTPEEGS